MAQDKFFEKFPTFTYANTTAVDITKRITLLDVASANPYIYYPYEITSDERAEQFSNRYYSDSYQSWILYISNKIVDPYYEWYLSQEQFKNFIVKKYGSVENSFKIKFYRDASAGVENIAVNYYDSLTPLLKEYWEPVYSSTYPVVIFSYKRKVRNLTSTTNKMVSYEVANNAFIKDEICDIVFSNNYKGKGQVAGIIDGSVRIHHVSGNFIETDIVHISSSSYIEGRESGVKTAFTSANLLLSNLHPEEEIYWEPVSYFEYERDKNEYNKTIRVLDKGLSQKISRDLTDLMKV